MSGPDPPSGRQAIAGASFASTSDGPPEERAARRATDRRRFGFAAGVWAASRPGLWLSPTRAWTVPLAVATVLLGTLAWAPAALALLRRGSVGYRPRHLRRSAAWGIAAVLLGAICGLTSTAAR